MNKDSENSEHEDNKCVTAAAESHDIILDWSGEHFKLFIHCEKCIEHFRKYHAAAFQVIASSNKLTQESLERPCSLSVALRERGFIDVSGRIHKLTLNFDEPKEMKACCGRWVKDFVATKQFGAFLKSMSADGSGADERVRSVSMAELSEIITAREKAADEVDSAEDGSPECEEEDYPELIGPDGKIVD